MVFVCRYYAFILEKVLNDSAGLYRSEAWNLPTLFTSAHMPTRFDDMPAQACTLSQNSIIHLTPFSSPWADLST